MRANHMHSVAIAIPNDLHSRERVVPAEVHAADARPVGWEISVFNGNCFLCDGKDSARTQYGNALRRSPTLAKYVKRSLGSLLADAQDRGLTIRNAVHEVRQKRKKAEARDRGSKLKVGVDIPTPDEIKAIIHAAKAAGVRSCSRQYSQDCAPPNCAACGGRMSISKRASSTFVNAPIAAASLDHPRALLGSARCPCPRPS